MFVHVMRMDTSYAALIDPSYPTPGPKLPGFHHRVVRKGGVAAKHLDRPGPTLAVGTGCREGKRGVGRRATPAGGSAIRPACLPGIQVLTRAFSPTAPLPCAGA